MCEERKSEWGYTRMHSNIHFTSDTGAMVASARPRLSAPAAVRNWILIIWTSEKKEIEWKTDPRSEANAGIQQLLIKATFLSLPFPRWNNFSIYIRPTHRQMQISRYSKHSDFAPAAEPTIIYSGKSWSRKPPETAPAQARLTKHKFLDEKIFSVGKFRSLEAWRQWSCDKCKLRAFTIRNIPLQGGSEHHQQVECVWSARRRAKAETFICVFRYEKLMSDKEEGKGKVFPFSWRWRRFLPWGFFWRRWRRNTFGCESFLGCGDWWRQQPSGKFSSSCRRLSGLGLAWLAGVINQVTLFMRVN